MLERKSGPSISVLVIPSYAPPDSGGSPLSDINSGLLCSIEAMAEASSSSTSTLVSDAKSKEGEEIDANEAMN